MGEVLQAPSEGYYQAIAQSGLPTAAALAPALFLLRLAMYHWQRLFGDDDSVVRVLGDWVTAAALAIAAGPFLDLLVRLSWWASGKMLGETAVLAQAFVSIMSVAGTAGVMGNTMFSGLITFSLAIAGVIGLAGIFFAFAAANATLYLMAVVGPVISIISVISQMHWMRGLWIKAVGVIALLPIVVGGLFKASVSISLPGAGSGMLAVLIRTFWVMGSAGAMLSLAGILGKFTISATLDAVGKFADAAKGVVETAAMAGVGGGGGLASAGAAAGGGGMDGGAAAASGGAAAGGGGMGGATMAGGGAAAGGGTGGSTGGATGGGGGPGGATGGGGGMGAAQQHYSNAMDYTRQGAGASALGMNKLAGFRRSQAQLETLAARKTELSDRVERFSSQSTRPSSGDSGTRQPSPPSSGDSDTNQSPPRRPPSNADIAQGLGMTKSQMTDALSPRGYDGHPGQFATSFGQLNNLAKQQGFDLSTFAPQYPEAIGRMARYYEGNHAAVEGSSNPLEMVAHGAGATQIAGIVG
ncbi:MAG: hypothetical protein KKD28_12400 [Chloroflexi bacterium]|nr:hypothetical protein [Chloroflexota bacterium]